MTDTYLRQWLPETVDVPSIAGEIAQMNMAMPLADASGQRRFQSTQPFAGRTMRVLPGRVRGWLSHIACGVVSARVSSYVSSETC